MIKYETRIPEENLRTGLTCSSDDTCPRARVLSPPQSSVAEPKPSVIPGPAGETCGPRPSPPLPGPVSLTPLRPGGSRTAGEGGPGDALSWDRAPTAASAPCLPSPPPPGVDRQGQRLNRADTRARRRRHHYLSRGPGGRAAGAAREARGNNGGGGAGACVAGSVPRCRGASGSATSLTRKARRVSAGSRTFQAAPEKPGPERAAPRLHRDLASAPLRMCARRTLRARGANRKPRPGPPSRPSLIPWTCLHGNLLHPSLRPAV